MYKRQANKKPIKDTTKPSFSSTFFKAQTGNRTDDLTNWQLGGITGLEVGILPAATSPLLQAASFDGVTASQLDKVNFIGAFGSENWTSGWTNFDPQNANY